jgi:hypothetical protein
MCCLREGEEETRSIRGMSIRLLFKLVFQMIQGNNGGYSWVCYVTGSVLALTVFGETAAIHILMGSVRFLFILWSQP